jgi:hypothetical protein
LWFGTKSGPVREVHGGSGYWSQDAATQVMACPEPVTALEVFWPGGKLVRYPLSAEALEWTASADGTIRATAPAEAAQPR